jgi:hypothetical protein
MAKHFPCKACHHWLAHHNSPSPTQTTAFCNHPDCNCLAYIPSAAGMPDCTKSKKLREGGHITPLSIEGSPPALASGMPASEHTSQERAHVKAGGHDSKTVQVGGVGFRERVVGRAGSIVRVRSQVPPDWARYVSLGRQHTVHTVAALRYLGRNRWAIRTACGQRARYDRYGGTSRCGCPALGAVPPVRRVRCAPCEKVTARLQRVSEVSGEQPTTVFPSRSACQS